MAEARGPLYSTCVAVLGFVCFVVGATAVGLPVWGYFDTPNGESRHPMEKALRGGFRQVGGLETLHVNKRSCNAAQRILER